MNKNKLSKSHQNLLFDLFLKYGEITIRTLTLEIEEMKSIREETNEEVDQNKVQLLYEIAEYLVSQIKITEGVVIRVKYEDKVLLIGNENVIRGTKTRQQVVNDKTQTKYILLDAYGDVYTEIAKRIDFEILPEDDESEIFAMQEHIQEAFEQKIEHMISHFDQHTFAVQSHVLFAPHPTIPDEKIQVQLCIVREAAIIPPGHCQIINNEHVKGAIQHHKSNGSGSSDLTGGFNFKIKGEA